jgi:hypothetical protein
MRDLDKADRDRRIAALVKLALGTGKYPPIRTKDDERAMQGFLLMYLDDTAMFPCDVFVEACERRRRASPFFPASSELLDECRTVATREQERREEQARKRLPPPAPSPEKTAEFLGKIRALARKKAMR